MDTQIRQIYSVTKHLSPQASDNRATRSLCPRLWTGKVFNIVGMCSAGDGVHHIVNVQAMSVWFPPLFSEHCLSLVH